MKRTTVEIQQAIRFNLFHILQASARAEDAGVPRIARNLLTFRETRVFDGAGDGLHDTAIRALGTRAQVAADVYRFLPLHLAALKQVRQKVPGVDVRFQIGDVRDQPPQPTRAKG